MTFESESCKHLRDWIAKAKKVGDTRSVQLLEFLLADEVNHVLYGTHWVDELTKNDPERRKRVLAYPEKVLTEYLNFAAKVAKTAIGAVLQVVLLCPLGGAKNSLQTGSTL